MMRYVEQNSKGKIAVIAYEDNISEYNRILPDADVYNFGKRGEESMQAQLLFKILRDTDKKDYDAIYAPLPGTTGIGLALYNRMIRAAAHKIIRL
jgi:L-threonylcarbamoyladenylate synthase